MVNSMTGFATMTGQSGQANWVWEIRSVNNKGFDLRQRAPDGFESFEKQIRNAVGKVCTRGTVYVSLKAKFVDTTGTFELNPQALTAAIKAAKTVADEASYAGFDLADIKATDFFSVPGVFERSATAEDASWHQAAADQIDDLAAAFAVSRQAEGAALSGVLSGQIDQIAKLKAQASATAEAQKETVAARLKDNIAQVMAAAETPDETRLHQELALLAIKNDVTEELDRLDAHIDAARALIGKDGPIGRKFDFLMQEFNREANTLCSKSSSVDLTRIGLDLKTIIDQMREQVQNVE